MNSTVFPRWVLAANGSRARLFEQNSPRAELREIADFANPQGRLPDRDLVSDAQGRYAARAGAGAAHSDSESLGAADHATELFAKAIVNHVEKARTENRYGRLVVIASPKFLGTLRGNMGKDLKGRLEAEIPKDVSQNDAGTIASYLPTRAGI